MFPSKYDDVEYTFFGVAEFDLMESLGFDTIRTCQEGVLKVGSRGLKSRCAECNENLPRPNYITHEMAPDWPHANYREAHKIVSTMGPLGEAFSATVKGQA